MHNKIHDPHMHDSHSFSKMITSMKLLATILLIIFLLPYSSPDTFPILHPIVGSKVYWPNCNQSGNTLLIHISDKKLGWHICQIRIMGRSLLRNYSLHCTLELGKSFALGNLITRDLLI